MNMMFRITSTVLMMICISAGCGKYQTSSLDETPVAKDIFKNNDQRANACLLVARQLSKNGDSKAALKQFQRALKFKPSLKIAHELALEYASSDLRSKAEQSFQQALQQKPKDPELLNDYAYFLSLDKDWKKAETLYREAIKQNPNYDKAYINLGLLLGQQGRFAESEKLFAKVLDEASVKHNMGVLLAQHGKRDEATIAWRKASMLNPDLTQPQQMLELLETNGSNIQQAAHFE